MAKVLVIAKITSDQLYFAVWKFQFLLGWSFMSSYTFLTFRVRICSFQLLQS